MRSSVVNLIYWPGPQTCSRKFQFSYLCTAKYYCPFEGQKVFGYQTETGLLNEPGT